jgi:hypothetical protein
MVKKRVEEHAIKVRIRGLFLYWEKYYEISERGVSIIFGSPIITYREKINGDQLGNFRESIFTLG